LRRKRGGGRGEQKKAIWGRVRSSRVGIKMKQRSFGGTFPYDNGERFQKGFVVEMGNLTKSKGGGGEPKTYWVPDGGAGENCNGGGDG